MRLIDIIAEWQYMTDRNNAPAIVFSEANSNIKDFYYKLARQEVRHLISSYLSQRAWLGKLIRGCITDFINSHGPVLDKDTYNSLAKRIVRSIQGQVKETEA